MSSTMVIKVKYGNSLRRFNADEDGDVVTLVDDDDLRDAMKQQLKFLRIDVVLNNDKGGKFSTRSSGISTPLRSPRGKHPLLNINSGAAPEVLKSLTEPLREVLSKLSLDLAAKASSSSPTFAEFVDSLSKEVLSHSRSQFGGDTQTTASESPVVQPAPSGLNASKDCGMPEVSLKSTSLEPSSKINQEVDVQNVTGGVGTTATPVTASADLNFLHAVSSPFKPFKTPLQKCPVTDTGKGSSAPQKTSVEPSQTSICNNPFSDCPFLGMPLLNDKALPPSTARRIHPFKRNYTDAMGGIFHRGVQCDGCGARPITGPRFKSQVREDYDLCSICFSEMGNETDYIRIDHPMSFRYPRLLKGFHEHKHPWPVPPVIPHLARGGVIRTSRPKLDSRFILDVNVMDGTVMAPSTPFTKIWRILNSGGLVWPQGTQLVWIGGDRFSDSVSAEIEIPAGGLAVDNELDIAVDFTAPELPGRYISYWRMASPSGQKFGQRVWVLVQVDASVNDMFSESFQGLNLNLPPKTSESSVPELIDVNVQPEVDVDFLQPCSSMSTIEPVKPTGNEQGTNEQELHFPINDSLVVSHGVLPSPVAEASSPVSYPIVDYSEPALTVDFSEATPSAAAPYPTTALAQAPAPAVEAEETSANNAGVENILLKELAEMGFKQVDLNKEILRLNEYNLEQSLDDLCGVSEWDPILEELHEMGFSDTETNKKLLVKNNGSLKRVVMDLISGQEE
ncbi:hypothetical protein FNV43_RR20281 [Rhamnella rubrinervis]|uniref:ZZ-type domain-containing protein n=1 Tax=Rhamnella rubrinervis TaxID=2594499 RepID=A0A8K0E655_9ROSA|nr:hypothetical protein FNV43_RR20281 [Rhamnella rubrinervis]